MNDWNDGHYYTDDSEGGRMSYDDKVRVEKLDCMGTWMVGRGTGFTFNIHHAEAETLGEALAWGAQQCKRMMMVRPFLARSHCDLYLYSGNGGAQTHAEVYVEVRKPILVRILQYRYHVVGGDKPVLKLLGD